MPPTRSDLQDAKAVVEWVLGISLEPVQRWAPEPRHDFDLIEDGLGTGAMVVVRSGRPTHPRSWGSVRRLHWAGCGLSRSWTIRLEAVTRSSPDQRMIVGLLAELERAGGTGFNRADQVRVAALRACGIRLSPAERLLEDLAAFGVNGGAANTDRDGPPSVVAKASEPALTSAEAVNEAVEDAVWRVPNRVRLGSTEVGDNHLFVWLNRADPVATAAMDRDEVPRPPLLAPETTTLWVARRPATGDGGLADRVWQTNGAGEWEALGSVLRRHLLAPASRA